MRVFNLDVGGDEDECDIRIYVPGPPGPPMVDVGTRTAPVLITGSIAAPLYAIQRSFIKGNAGPVIDPTIPNGSGTQRLYLFTTDDTNSVTLNGSSNVQLSGQWIGLSGSILCLQWDNISKWVEEGRNEI